MKVGIFLSYIGLGSNILHLSYCHEIAKKYGPVTVITICKNFKEAVDNDPSIKEVIYIDKYFKKFSDVFKLAKKLASYNLDSIYIFYPSVRLYLAGKLAKISEVKTYPIFKKKNLHLVNAAKNFVEKNLDIKKCPTETTFYVDPVEKMKSESQMNKSFKKFGYWSWFFRTYNKVGGKKLYSIIKKT